MSEIRPRNPRRGQAAIMVTLSLIPTLGLLGLVVDIGYSYYRKQMAQTAAETAAIAAAMAVENNALTCNTAGLVCQDATACPASPTLSATSNMTNGCLYAKQNGFVNSGNQTVTMEAHLTTTKSPPVTGASPAYWVSATITETEPTLFSAVLGKASTLVVARSTSGVFTEPANACIYSLAPNGNGLKVNGSVTINSSCGVYVDSNSTTNPYALDFGGSSANMTASKIQIVGSWNQNGNGTVSPTPLTGVASTADPLASIQAPKYTESCDDNGSLPTMSASTISSKMAAHGGVFEECSTFTINGGSAITLPAGTYVMKNAGISWKNGTISGTGVTFYFTGSGGSDTISINGNMNVNLTAPSTGLQHGMLFMQDRSISNESMSISINGGSGLVLDGALYFPGQDVSYSGGSTTTNNYTALIAYTITFVGNSYFKADLGGNFTGIGAPQVGVLE
jgi:Flp pilus assembly protein TadG